MHLVFLTSIVPAADAVSGFEIANRAILDALSACGVRVSVVGYSWPGRPAADPAHTVVLGETDVRTEGASTARRLRWLGMSVARGVPFSSAKLRLVSGQDFKGVLQSLEPADGYVLNGSTLAGAYEALLTSRPFVYVAHNVEHVSAGQSAVSATSPWERIMFRREAVLLRSLEQRLCARARFVFTLAEEDRAPLGVASAARSCVLPLTTVRNAPAPHSDRHIQCDLALIGTWTWAPNRIGLEWFLSQVAPLLPQGLDIRIAGDAPSDFVRRYPAARFVGRVPDATQFAASGAVVPLVSRAGTGVQLKTIETFELGLPSVATSSALRGLTAIPGNCTRADDPGTFAAALAAKLAAVRGGQDDLADGRAFHARQKTLINQAIRFGLEKFREHTAPQPVPEQA